LEDWWRWRGFGLNCRVVARAETVMKVGE
jgi:hypothetical protein